jgi:hypothetical protein
MWRDATQDLKTKEKSWVRHVAHHVQPGGCVPSLGVEFMGMKVEAYSMIDQRGSILGVECGTSNPEDLVLHENFVEMESRGPVRKNENTPLCLGITRPRVELGPPALFRRF